MAVVTLTTDWGHLDYYVASLKGELISLRPDVRIVDISHNIGHFDTLQASYVLRNCFDKFPKESIHFVGMQSGLKSDESQGYLLIKCRSHYFIGYDSGVFYLTLGEEEKKIYKLSISPTVPVYLANKKLCAIISSILNGDAMESSITETTELVKSFNTQPVSGKSEIRGTVIHIDHFYNVISNITRELFEQIGHHLPFSITIRDQRFSFKKLHQNYADAEESELVVLFNENGNLVIALNRAKAASLLGMKLFDNIRVEFEIPPEPAN